MGTTFQADLALLGGGSFEPGSAVQEQLPSLEGPFGYKCKDLAEKAGLGGNIGRQVSLDERVTRRDSWARAEDGMARFHGGLELAPDPAGRFRGTAAKRSAGAKELGLAPAVSRTGGRRSM